MSRGHVQLKSSPISETRKDHNESFEKERYPYTSSVSQDIQSTHSHMERSSQLVSSETESDLAHTQQSITCASPCQVREQCDRSRYVSAQSHLRGMDGKSRKFDPAKGVVNTPLCVTQLGAPLRSILADPEEWELTCCVDESVCWGEAYRTEPFACCPIIKCGTTECIGSGPLFCGRIWVHSWEKASHVRDLWEHIPAF